MISLYLADPEFQMWMHIGFGLAVFAGATLLWVLFNRSRAKKSSRRGSFSQYGTMTQEEKTRNEKGQREKVGSESYQMTPIEPSKVMGEYRDKGEFENEGNKSSLFEVLSSLVESVGDLLQQATFRTLTLRKRRQHFKQTNEI